MIADGIWVRGPLPDISWTSLDLPWHAAAGETFSVQRTYDVANRDADKNFTIVYYGSENHEFGDADDVVLHIETITNPADKTVGTHAGSTSFSITTEGVYNVFARIDDAGAVAESDEANNVAAARVSIGPTAQTFVDDEDAGYAETGTWTESIYAVGYKADYRYHAAGSGTDTASWTVSGIPVGNYEVLATWVATSNRATDATYAIFDGASSEDTVVRNQRSATNGEEMGGVWWESLGAYPIDNGSLKVEVGQTPTGYLVADAIWVREIPPPSPPAEASAPAANAGALAGTQVEPIASEPVELESILAMAPGPLARLEEVDVVLTDVPSATLGIPFADRIDADENATGQGWSIDKTPDEESPASESQSSVQAIVPEAVDRIDLLTVVSHELGQILTQQDLDAVAQALMVDRLHPGQRSSPGKADADTVFADESLLSLMFADD